LVVEVPVYRWEKLVLLTHLLEQGLTKTAIAAQVGVSRRTLYHWLETGQLDRDLSPAVPRTRVQRPAKLDPYKPIIDTRLATYPELSAVRLFSEVQAAGYLGGITQLRDYVQQVRPRVEPDPVVRFETPPGLQAQVDFADFQFPWGKRHALLVVLGHSRLLWLTFYPRQTMRTLMTGLETAFTSFGGVPRELLFDQLKAVIIEDRRPDDGRLIENPEFLRFAAHWGFRIRACRPYRAQTKGKVERPVSYVRGNFVYGREFLGDADLAAQTAGWLDDIANVRCHGTTGEAPRLRFERDERAVLLPLAARPYEPLIPLLPRRTSTRATALDIPVERRPLESYTALLEVG
jgi:transposase